MTNLFDTVAQFYSDTTPGEYLKGVVDQVAKEDPDSFEDVVDALAKVEGATIEQKLEWIHQHDLEADMDDDSMWSDDEEDGE